jgi:hypothetical protein
MANTGFPGRRLVKQQTKINKDIPFMSSGIIEKDTSSSLLLMVDPNFPI